MVSIKTAEINRSNYGARRTVQPQWIVMHYTANDGDSDESNVRYFQDNIVKASAHYFVDDDSITRTVPDDYVAYHCGANVYFHPSCRNYNSIGIELCDAKRDGTAMATPATIENAAQLVAQLCRQYNILRKLKVRALQAIHPAPLHQLAQLISSFSLPRLS